MNSKTNLITVIIVLFLTPVTIFAQTEIAWFNQSDTSAHGTFNIIDGQTFNLDANLTVNNNKHAYVDGWDGRTLTKQGDGTLIMSGSSVIGDVKVQSGTIGITGYLSGQSGYIGQNTNENASVFISNSGYWQNPGNLDIGYSGTGSLSIRNSGSFSSQGGVYLGSNIGGYGSISIQDNATLKTAGLFIGNDGGSGLLTISGSGQVETTYVSYIACYAGSSGTAIIKDNGYWHNDADLIVSSDRNQHALLYIGTSGSLKNYNTLIIGDYSPTSDGTVIVDGRLDSGKYMYVGLSGTGVLAVNGSGYVGVDADTFMGLQSTSQGTALISGSAIWYTRGTLTIAYSGTAALTITDHASVRANSVVIGDDSMSSGTLIFLATDATLTGTDGISPVAISGGNGQGNVIFNHSGNMNFANPMSGANLNTDFVSGTTTLTTANAYQGNTTIHSGAILRGGVQNIIAQSNTLTVNSGATFEMGGFDQLLQNLHNDGLVNFTNIGRTLTVNRNLTGNGNFRMDVDIAANTGDKLVINGDAAGTHRLLLNGQGANPTGTEPALTVVEVGGANNATFTGGLEWGAYNYTAQRDGNNIVLARQDVGPTGESAFDIPGAQNIAWFSQQDNLVKRMGELRAGKQKLNESWIDNAWVRSYGEQTNANTGVTDRSFRVQLWGIDIGIDKGWQLDPHNQFFTGVFIGYGEANQDFHNCFGSTGKSDAINFGAYATWIEDSGWYADIVFKAAHFDNSFDAYNQNYNKTTASYDNWGIGGSLEIGKQFRFQDGWFVEPMAQMSYAHLMNGNYGTEGSNLVNVTQRDADIFQFRGGARFGRNINLNKIGTLLQPYVKVAGVEQISSGGDIAIDTASWRPNMDGARAEIGAGLIWQLDANNQLHLDYEAAFGDKYDKPWGFNAGYRYRF